MKQIIWGLFKKIVIADNCAKIVNIIFANQAHYDGSTLFVGAILFAFQIYGDFSGYSDIAIGTSRLFGFDLKKNFAFPYFSRDIAEFWRRWHISLSSWFRDYLYIPLGGSKGSTVNKIRNIFIIFLVSGFWHGASWNYIAWGLINAIYFLPIMLLNKNRINTNLISEGRLLPSLRDLFNILLTFCLTSFAWIFFRAKSLDKAIDYIYSIFTKSFFSSQNNIPPYLIVLILIFIIIEWIGRHNEYAIQTMSNKWHSVLRYSFYYAIIICIFSYSGSSQQFIYFQF